MTSRTVATAGTLGVLAGLALDAALGDPSRWHPVAGFGQAATTVQTKVEKDSRAAGVAFVALTVAPCVAAGVAGERLAGRSAARYGGLTALTCFSVVAGRSLRREARAIQQSLNDGDLPAARQRLRSLCGRDASTLDEADLSRAVVESLAENTSDAVIGPLVWWSLGGLPGLVGYRAVNTLDAMVGHHSPRYERFGWAAARLDDLANLVPSRLGGAIATLSAPLLSGDPRRALDTWRRDASAHPSPNAGVVEAAFAGALDLRLGGRIDYPYGPSERPLLNAHGRAPTTADIGRAVRLSRLVQAGAVATCVAARLLLTRRGRR
ncbi:MAG TPA: cobalamin biosynthesis protein [Mycobacteriales bacterium]|nr:cobalamin biosynthesis protein [Mycobacteriales bacterium]